MKTFWALVWREIAERRLLLLASLLLGIVPILLPFMPGIPARFSPEEIRVAATLILAALFSGISLLILGSTIVGRDLSEKRLGFYFSRPINSWVLWLSRILGASALVLVSILLIVTPSTVADGGSWLVPLWERDSGPSFPILGLAERQMLGHLSDERPTFGETPTVVSPATRVAFTGMIVLLLLTLIHAGSTMVRGRNLWVLADLAGLVVVLFLGWSAREALVREQALGALVWCERLFVPAVLAVLGVAGGVQLARGRVDMARGHRYLSATLWPSLVVVMLAFTGYARWIESSTVADLARLTRFQAAPGERWLMAGGPVKHRAGARAAFLIEVDTGYELRLGNLDRSRAWLAFSPDGNLAVWAHCEAYRPPACELWAKDLRDAASPPWPTGISILLAEMRWTPGSRDQALTFDDDGKLLAIAEAKRLVVYEVGRTPEASEPRVVAAVDAKLPEAVTFLPENRVRFHQRVPSDPEIDGDAWIRIRELDLATRRLVDTGRLPAGIGGPRSRSQDLLFFQKWPGLGLRVHDGETGEARVEADAAVPSMAGWGRFLTDGRLVVGRWRPDAPGQPGGDLRLRVLTPEGQELHRFERTGVTSRSAGGELAPGKLLIAWKEKTPPATSRHRLDVPPRHGWTTYLLDADAGELIPLASGILPLGKSRASAERLFLAGDDHVIRWNIETGEVRTILPVESGNLQP